jgi:cobalt-zinc-cadmium efflux system membrane fusion protein
VRIGELTGIAAALGSALLLAGCGTNTTPKANAEAASNPLEIRPHAELLKQVEVGRPSWEAVSTKLRVAGRVEADERRLARVSAPVTGRIVEVKVFEGEHVREGQILATVYSTELSSAQSAYLKALTEQLESERSVERARQLLAADVIGSAELQRRQAALQQAQADVAAAREQLRVLGLDEAAITELQRTRAVHSTTHILSSIDGTVLERKATVGQVVAAVEPVFVIADLSRVWLVANVPEQSAGDLRVGKSVEAEVPALHGRKLTGQLSFISSTVDADTRTVETRMDMPNPERLLKPAMLTNMTLVGGSEQRLVLPSSAVVREGNRDHVFVQTAPGTFMLRPVTLDAEIDELRVVQDGLSETEQIVLNGAFHLNNERKRLLLGGDES